MKYSYKTFFVSLAILFVLVGVFFLFNPNTKSKPLSWLGDIRSGLLIAFTNQERKNINLDELIENQTLNQAAQLKAQDMAQKSYFAHYSPEGLSPWVWFQKAGYQYERAGENLAVLFTHSEDVVRAWMNSPTHRANILKEGYTEIGIGTAQGIYKGKNTTYIVQLFGRPKENTSQTLFTLETKQELVTDDVQVLGIESVQVSMGDLFKKEYLVVMTMLATLIVLIAFLLSKLFSNHRKKNS